MNKKDYELARELTWLKNNLKSIQNSRGNSKHNYKKYIKENPNAIPREIAAHFGVTRRAVSYYIKKHNINISDGRKTRWDRVGLKYGGDNYEKTRC